MSDPAMSGRTDRALRSRPLLRTMIGDVLRRTRVGQGRTLSEVARIARVSMPYLSELERGRKEASSEVLAAICEALQIELSDLLAAVGRDLHDVRDRRHGREGRPAAVRIDSLDGRRRQQELTEPGAAVPHEARVVLGPGSTPPGPAAAARSSGDLRCLLRAA